jgi:hypothetical protein
MIARDDITAETYFPIPFSIADHRCLKKAFRDHAPHLELAIGHTDTGIPFLTVTDPAASFDDAPPCITRGERGWQMHRGRQWATV